jgi:hypothetical protein
VITTATMEESERNAWCRAQGIFPSDLQQWRDSATTALAQPEEARASPQQTREDKRKIKVVGGPFGSKPTSEDHDRQDEKNWPDEDLGLHLLVSASNSRADRWRGRRLWTNTRVSADGLGLEPVYKGLRGVRILSTATRPGIYSGGISASPARRPCYGASWL